MQKRTAPVQCLLAGLLVAAVLLSPLAAQAAKTADAPTQNADQDKKTEKDKETDKGKDNDKEKKNPKVTVSLTSPQPGAVVTAPADIPLAADAQSTQKNHPVVEVDFYQGTTLIGTSTLAPFGFTWRNVPSGTYTLTAVASNEKKDKEKDKDDDKDGKHDKLDPEHQARSAPVQIIVNAPPTVNLTAPAAGTVVTAPAMLVFAAQASDADGTVAKVDFYQGTTLLGSATQAPYVFTWANAPAGSYVLTAVATDNRGAATTSTPVPIIVNAPPTVSLTAPMDKAVLFAPTDVAITAQASDADGTVAKVEFFQGTTLLGTVTQAPYAFTWLNAPAGTYSLMAKATDNWGASTASAPAALTVDIPPSVSLSATALGDLVAPAALALTAQASDPDGTVAKVEFYQGNTLLGSATQAPYAYTWSNVAVGSYTLTAQATDNKGATTVSSPLALTVIPAQVKGVFYIYPDHLGTPRVVTDEANKVIWRNDPLGEPFGAGVPNEDPDGDGLRFTLNLRFPGQYFDSESGLSYNYFRDYDPSTGKYIQSDPIGLAGGLNLYAYANNAPTMFTDPLGLETYQCKRPLGGKPGDYLAYDNVTHHQYSCVNKTVCGGQGPSGSPLRSPGKPTDPSEDYYHPDACKKTQDDNKCFEQCLIEEWNKPRPTYSTLWGLGTHCQEYDDDVNQRCRKKCGLK